MRLEVIWFWCVTLWFCSSVLAAVVENVIFVVWLRRKHVPFVFGLSGLPSYVNKQYLAWCRSVGEEPRWAWLRWRRLLLANALIAAAAFVGTVGSS